MKPLACGVDVGRDRLHCVALDRERKVGEALLFTGSEIDGLVAAVAGARVVAVDAPAQLSTMPHRDDEASLSVKFRSARCAEIALGREHGSWVPFVAPAERPSQGWIATGLALFEALAVAGLPAVEVFPFAGFRTLAAGRPLPTKSSARGIRARVALLREAGVAGAHLQMWSHDGLDALLGALIGAHHAEGRARPVTCGHDGSAIWLPAA